MQRDGIEGEHGISMKVQNCCNTMGKWVEGREEERDMKSKQLSGYIEISKSS